MKRLTANILKLYFEYKKQNLYIQISSINKAYLYLTV